MEKIYSKVEPNRLLHIVNRLNDILHQQTHRVDLCDEKEFVQIATLKMEEGKTFYPHKHIFRDGPKQVITQETWIIISGAVKAIYYDIDDTIIDTKILQPGDCSATFGGGHNYLILHDNTIVYEIKQGPYYGVEKDKVAI